MRKLTLFVRTAPLAILLSSFGQQALATSTLRYSCVAKAVEESRSAQWVYILKGQATVGSEGFVQFQPGSPTITATRNVVLPGGQTSATVYVDNAPLTHVAFGASYLAYELPNSRYGLSVNFYPDAPSLIVFHNTSPSSTLVSDSNVQCEVEEVG